MKVVISFTCDCPYSTVGDRLFLVGDTRELGKWGSRKSLELETSEGQFPIWKLKIPVELEVMKTVYYKFQIRRDWKTIWEDHILHNRILKIPTTSCFISHKWSNPLHMAILPVGEILSFEDMESLSKAMKVRNARQNIPSFATTKSLIVESDLKVYEGGVMYNSRSSKEVVDSGFVVKEKENVRKVMKMPKGSEKHNLSSGAQKEESPPPEMTGDEYGMGFGAAPPHINRISAAGGEEKTRSVSRKSRQLRAAVTEELGSALSFVHEMRQMAHSLRKSHV
eukprot:Filipodium_phascolosomae@DN1658_c0_g1_i1.p1